MSDPVCIDPYVCLPENYLLGVSASVMSTSQLSKATPNRCCELKVYVFVLFIGGYG